MKPVLRSLLATLAASALIAAEVPPPAPVSAGYQPSDKDERGLWMQAQEYERNLGNSSFVMRDPELNAYVRKILCRTIGESNCADIRVYIIRTPYFNASMAPNGVLEIWSGLLLRLQNEAQLAAVLDHEYGHYQQRHSLQLFRNARNKSGAAVWFSMFGLAGQLVSLGMISSVFQFSREMETQADSLSVDFMAHGHYDPRAAVAVWENLRAEMDATAAARNQKSRKNQTGGIFATHPPTLERVANLKSLADKLPSGDNRELGREAYIHAIQPYWASLIDDQIKLNDFGASEFLLAQLAQEGWSSRLLLARAELYRSRGTEKDLTAAAGFYRDAMALPDAAPEVWRGLGIALLRSGKTEEGQAMLKEYLSRRPDCPDRTMIAMLAGGKQ
jgi:beta-barrel assembly-enhancing protease